MRRDVEMTFMEHLEELRDRIIYSLYAVVPAMGISFTFARPLLEIITSHARTHGVGTPQGGSPILFNYSPLIGPFLTFQPISGSQTVLQTLGPVEYPIQIMKVAFVASIFMVFPFIMYQAWRFIEPGLKENERKYLGPFLLFSWAFFIVGGLFAYFVMLKVAVPMLLKFGEGIAVNSWALSYYVSFVLRTILAFGIVFEMPVVVALLATLGLVTPAFLRAQWRIAILVIFIASAILTPTTDPFSLLLMAVPLMFLYAFSIGVAKYFQRKPMELTPTSGEE